MTSRIPDEWTYGRALRPREAADVLGISTATITRWGTEGLIGFFRIPGNDRRYPECEIRRIMNGDPPPDFLRDRAEKDQKESRRRWQDGGYRKNEFMASRVRSPADDDDE